ncbi:MAG: hypothetical protein KKE62_09595 [Proteobacteria bacterium]|nr:hypothetical protein [Pseudomonadota bacterium]MBU1388744.1 hypothetical protein [Pseudomonadota bacterium]MBU1543085.1 hypothetical protein [Pseudomonadota bacterium]MBU2430805.1 hypothetical protein [Pseudomonadota bacterium]
MTQDNRLSVLDIARELNTGHATIKFLLKRFKSHIPFELIDGQPLYPVSALPMLIMIQEKLEIGILPSEIEDMLKTQDPEDAPSLASSLKDIAGNTDIRLSHDGLHMLKSLFNDIGKQQERIAAAHEKRAEVEERKALAIEKRAQAEENKAQAMNNIAAALQEMNKLRASDAATQQIAHQTGTVIITDESQDPGELDNLSELISDSEMMDDTVTDLSGLLDEEDIQTENLTQDDPLKDEIDTEFDNDLDIQFDQELEDSLDDPLKDFDEDLLDEDLESEDLEFEDPLDDLSALIDETPEDKPQDTKAMELDDLSRLIDSPDDQPKDQPDDPLDDLSALIDETPEDKPQDTKDMELDDLSRLIDSPDDQPEHQPDVQLDDLSKLIDPVVDEDPAKETSAPISLDLNPEDDLVKYKAAVTKIIIELKSEGLTVEQTTDRLNKNHIKTLSGKSQWGQKAISQIYKFIDSAK